MDMAQQKKENEKFACFVDKLNHSLEFIIIIIYLMLIIYMHTKTHTYILCLHSS